MHRDGNGVKIPRGPDPAPKQGEFLGGRGNSSASCKDGAGKSKISPVPGLVLGQGNLPVLEPISPP